VAKRDKQLKEIAVSDRGTLRGLTQFPAMPVVVAAKPLKANVIGESCERHRACAIIFASRSQLVDSKRRDVRVVEGARLEIALTVCDGVLQISITVAKPTT
jgi:hypothetical protein